jgi:hypothetical protein
MDTEQLSKAQNDWSFSMDIWLENGKLMIANDGFITDNEADIKKSKHSGEYEGFFYYSKRKGTRNVLIGVINSINS